MTERNGANRVGGLEWHEQSRLWDGSVLGLSGRHDTESLCVGFAEWREGIAFAVRCWGWWNERRRNAVKDSEENEAKRNERKAWTEWRWSEWTYRKHMAIKQLMLYFLLHRWKGGGVSWDFGWGALAKARLHPVVGMLWCWLLNIMATYVTATALGCLHKRGVAVRSEHIRPHYV